MCVPHKRRRIILNTSGIFFIGRVKGGIKASMQVKLSNEHNVLGIFAENVNCVLVSSDADVLKQIKLHKEEIEIASKIGNVIRRDSFILGRKAARIALKKFTLEDKIFVGRGALGEPVWPEGFIGSISHTANWAICAVGSRKEIIGLGVDIEILAKKLNLKLSRRLSSDEESNFFDSLNSNDEDKSQRLLRLFSAKEAFYKSVFPTTKEFLGFRDVELKWSEDLNQFTGKIITPGKKKIAPVSGRCAEIGELLCSGAVLREA